MALFQERWMPLCSNCRVKSFENAYSVVKTIIHLLVTINTPHIVVSCFSGETLVKSISRCIMWLEFDQPTTQDDKLVTERRSRGTEQYFGVRLSPNGVSGCFQGTYIISPIHLSILTPLEDPKSLAYRLCYQCSFRHRPALFQPQYKWNSLLSQ